MSNDTLLELQHVSAGYGPIEAVRGVSLVVRKGEIVTVIGSNGAGKTSTLLAISGLLSTTNGKIIFSKTDITITEPSERVALGIAQIPEGRKIFPRLTVLENLNLGAFLRYDKQEVDRDRERMYELFPVLKDRLKQAGGTLSGGEQQMLAMARALMSRPSLLLMDEPSMGIAPLLVQKIFETILKLNKDGLTVLLVEQNAHLALEIAHRGYVLETGQVVLEDLAENLAKNDRVREAYLGE